MGTGGELMGTGGALMGTGGELMGTGGELMGTGGELMGTGGELMGTGGPCRRTVDASGHQPHQRRPSDYHIGLWIHGRNAKARIYIKCDIDHPSGSEALTSAPSSSSAAAASVWPFHAAKLGRGIPRFSTRQSSIAQHRDLTKQRSKMAKGWSNTRPKSW